MPLDVYDATPMEILDDFHQSMRRIHRTRQGLNPVLLPPQVGGARGATAPKCSLLFSSLLFSSLLFLSLLFSSVLFSSLLFSLSPFSLIFLSLFSSLSSLVSFLSSLFSLLSSLFSSLFLFSSPPPFSPPSLPLPPPPFSPSPFPSPFSLSRLPLRSPSPPPPPLLLRTREEKKLENNFKKAFRVLLEAIGGFFKASA